MKRSLLIALSLCASLFFISCQKDGGGPIEETPAPNPSKEESFRLKRIIQGIPGVKDSVVNFYYDAAGRLGGWTESMTPDSFAITYPTDPSKPVEVDMFKYKLYHGEFFYDANKRLTKYITTSGNLELEYDTKGIVSKIKSGGVETALPYDDKGNIKTLDAWTASSYTDLANVFAGMEIFCKVTSFDLDDLAMGNGHMAPVFAIASKHMPSAMKLGMFGGDQDYTISYDTDKDKKIISSKTILSVGGKDKAIYTRKYEWEAK